MNIHCRSMLFVAPILGDNRVDLMQYRGGPITVAEYMREVLYHPLGGFYAARGDAAIGGSGHFVTSPEISVLFGEVRCGCRASLPTIVSG